MNRNHHDVPPELADVASLLEEQRPELSALELDAVKRRAMSRASARSTTHPKGNFMKSRLAFISMLTAGLLMSGTGATLAIDGISATQNATTAQYGGGETDGGGEGSEVLGDSQSGSDQIPSGGEDTSGGEGAVNAGGGGGGGGETAAQPSRQVEQGTQTTGQLPFTGYAGITILLLGLALLSTGLVLRRSAGQPS